MAIPNQILIDSPTNTVNIQTNDNQLRIISPVCNTEVNVTQPTTTVIQVATPGTIGPPGPSGSFPSTGSFATTGSNIFSGSQTITGSIFVSGSLISTSFTGSLQGTSSWANNAITASYALNALSASFALTASFVQNAQTASYILNAVSSSFATSASFASTVPASGVIGLNLSQIATGSVTASVSPTQFTVTSASITEFAVRGTGVTIGNIVTDTHTVTGSLNISGSVTATNFTGSLFGTSSWARNATTASYAATSQLTNNIYFAQGALNENQGILDSTNIIIRFVDQFDPQGWWDANSYRFAPNIAGYYTVSLGVTLENTSNNTGYVQIQIIKASDTSSFVEMSCKQPLNTISDSSLFGSKIIYLNGNTDYLEFIVYQSSGGTFNILEGPGTDSPDTWFSATYMTM